MKGIRATLDQIAAGFHLLSEGQAAVIVFHRFGQMTLNEVAKRMRLRRERVLQLEVTANRKMVAYGSRRRAS